MFKKYYFALFLWAACSGCHHSPQPKNTEGEYRITATATDDEINALKDKLLKEHVRLDFSILQRDSSGKIQIVRCHLSSAIDSRKSNCETPSGFNYLLIQVSKNDLQCSVK